CAGADRLCRTRGNGDHTGRRGDAAYIPGPVRQTLAAGAGAGGRADDKRTGLERRKTAKRDYRPEPPLCGGGVKGFVLYNPAANGGRTKQEWPALSAALQTVFPRFIGTPVTARGQAARLVRDALREGHDQIVVVGGDGTVNEAVNGFFELGVPLAPDAVLN